MSIPANVNPLLLAADAATPSGYQIQRSLRCNSSDSAYCLRTPSSNGTSYTTWTWSMWVKRSLASTGQVLFSAGTTTSDYLIFNFEPGDTLRFVTGENGATNQNLVTTAAVFRDYSAWYNIVIQADFGNATQADRIKIYVNGTRQTISGTIATQGYAGTTFNRSGVAHNIGRQGNAVAYFSGYLADIHFIDGQALDPTSFTEVSATTGQLIPKAYTGTYGQVSVAAATGGLPIWNTTDTYGAAKGSGTRTDASSSSIVLALPMDGTNGGTSFGDQSAVIKGSGSAKTVTVNGNTNTSTAQSKFYGSSAYFDGAGDYLTLGSSADFAFGTGDFTIEAFVYRPSGGGLLIFDHLMGTGNFTIFSYSNQAITVYSNAAYSSGVNPGNDRWFHLAVVRTSGVLSFFIDGVKAANTYSFTLNMTTAGVNIGSSQYSEYGTQYLQDLRVYKGLAKYTTNFSPVTISNSFYLQFADNSSNTASTLGKDTSGNGNNWTPNNFSVTAGAGNDSLVDTPTSYGTDTGAGGEVRGNYATLSALAKGTNTVLSNGNLEAIDSPSGDGIAVGTIGISTGKWYWEITALDINGTTVNQRGNIGLVKNLGSNTLSTYLGVNANSYSYYSGDGTKANNGSSSSYGATWATNDVIGVALNLDAGTLVYYKNNTSQGTAFTGLNTGENYHPACSLASYGKVAFNFGQRAFAYTAPSGFKALCDTNLPAPVVAKGSTVMDVLTWTGNSAASRALTGLGFSPDFVWIKDRSNGYNHVLFDAVRGAGGSKVLFSNRTTTEGGGVGEEGTNYGAVTSFDSSGFTVAPGAVNSIWVNQSSDAYVAWTWDAGTSTVTNTQGSITSQVRANPSAGFSISTFTKIGNTNQTIGHGLGVAPSMVIVKTRQSSGYTGWAVYHASVGPNGYLELNTTSAFITLSSTWNNTAPTSTVFTMGTGWTATQDMVAYCFSPVAGYSSAFSFTGNGSSSDGPMVWLGFKPKLLLLKRTDSTGNWLLVDSVRGAYNLNGTYLYANTSDAEATQSGLGWDFLSNGFKIRNSYNDSNVSSATYIGFAWAESPFQYARAR